MELGGRGGADLAMCTGVGIMVMSTLILLFDVELPNELKGFFFYAQVSGRSLALSVLPGVTWCYTLSLGGGVGVPALCGGANRHSHYYGKCLFQSMCYCIMHHVIVHYMSM